MSRHSASKNLEETSLYGVYARTVEVPAILNMAIDLLSVQFEKILVMTSFKLELEDKLERWRRRVRRKGGWVHVYTPPRPT